MNKIFIYVKACSRRALDAAKVRDYLLENGYDLVENPKDADTIILFTCGGDDRIAKISLDNTRYFQKYKAELIVAGCLPDIETNKLSKIYNGKTLTTKELDKKIETIFPPKNKISFSKIAEANITFRNIYENHILLAARKIITNAKPIEKLYLKLEHHILSNFLGKDTFLYRLYLLRKDEFFILISRGCLGNCTYCGIKNAVGKLKSKPLNQCVEEFKIGLEEGFNKFIISAEDSGAYGLDINCSIVELLDIVTDFPGNYQISIDDFAVRWAVKYIDDLERIFKKGKISDIAIPIQSGSSRILKLMNRYSDVEKIKNIFYRLNRTYPNIKISTHYILGFPTETWDDFIQTLLLIIEMDIKEGLIFKFSCKEGTEAEKIEPKISVKEINKRWRYANNFFKKAGYYVICKKDIFMFAKIIEKQNISNNSKQTRYIKIGAIK